MFKSRLRLALQNMIIFGGLYLSIYYANIKSLESVIISLVALLIATLGSLSIVYKKKKVYHMVFTEDASEEDKQEGEEVYIEPRPNYVKGGFNYFLYGLGAVYASGTLIYSNLSKISLLIFVVSLILMVATRYNFKKHTPIMILEDMSIQFILFTGLAIIVRATSNGIIDLVNALMFLSGVLMFITMLHYRYHTVTYYKYKKTSKLPKNINKLVISYGFSLTLYLGSLGVLMHDSLGVIFTLFTVILVVAVLLFFRSDTLPSAKDIL